VMFFSDLSQVWRADRCRAGALVNTGRIDLERITP
ncbi:MAG: hypothetical protein ACI86S_000075, partial [Paracoccaceae bacterium]